MNKRNRSHRQSAACGACSGWLGRFEKKSKRDRRSWVFEQLEDRHYFTATPYTGLEGFQWYTVSNDTLQGQQLIDSLAQLWAEQASPMSGGGSSNTSTGSSIYDEAAKPLAVPTDPYLNYQWHLFNVGQVVNPGQFQDLYGVPGQDINVIPAWDLGYSGKGVNVAVVDDGVQLNHPDLVANIAQQYAYDAIRNRPGSGTMTADDNHGTAVAGLIGASANNGIGGVGVAYDSTIIPIKFLGAGATEQSFINAIGANGAPVDIYNHSWGYFIGRSVFPLTQQQLTALSNSARLGRDGLGAIHVFASGNFAEGHYSAGSSALVNSRYTIGVGMVDHDGRVDNSDGTITKYGNMAPSVLIVAPSASGPTDIINDFNTGSGIFTTDRTGNLGYNLPPLPSGVELDIDTFPDDAYTTRFGGTSAAAPLVSGVIALMLEANPNLTWRDVQEILVRSSRQNDDLDESWVTNLVPLFRDPIPHSGAPTNYPIDPEDPKYPSDESRWNDEIVYQLVGTELTPAEQAKTQPTSTTAGGTFSVHARAGLPWDGWVANNLTVVFRTVPGNEPGAVAEIVSGRIRITVTGEGVTWGQIRDAVHLLSDDPEDPDTRWFDFLFAAPATANNPFLPEDEAIIAPLSGGVDAQVVESTLQRNPQYLGYHPIADPITNPEPLSLFTNGAGYTVSHGRGGTTEYGWAHGVVNAELAVQLASQWHLKHQNLPSEKTYLVGGFGSIPIRGAQVTNEDSGEYVIPGALSNSTQGFAEYFNEFFKIPTITAGQEETEEEPATPDSIDPNSLPFAGDNPPANTRGSILTFNVPAIDPVTGGSNLMSVEWVEIQLTVSGDANAMDFLRITLVSPDGTHSELTQNQYMPANIIHNFQSIATGGVFADPAGAITAVDENGTNTNTLSWVYSTNRHWGERSDSKPIFDEYGNQIGTQGWELHFENYSGTTLTLGGVSMAVHGRAIGSSAAHVERIMGKVGVDSGRFITGLNQVVGANDGEFNFDRYVTQFSPFGNSSALNTPNFNFSTTPFGEHEIRVADPFQESFAGNVTVYVIQNSTGQRVSEFVTGYDGNYYFDLPAGEYTLGIEDPLGRSALSGGRNYESEWVITIDGTDRATREAGMIDEVTGKFYYLNNLNFLLDPGSVPIGEVVFTGQVLGDLNGNGAQDPQDVGVFNFLVFADLNHTGQFELGEPFTYTDPDGNYELHVPTGTPNTFSITVRPPAGWTPTSPANAVIHEYAKPGELVEGFKYLFKPPSSPTGTGNGTIFGFIFDDRNGDGIQQINEKGLQGFKVYLDANQNGQFDDGETFTLTNAAGAYQFGEVLGSQRIDVVVNEPYIMTGPAAGYIALNLVAGQVSTNNVFALRNLATMDFGDLIGTGYQTAAASHTVVPGFMLGSRIDAEVRPRYLIADPNSPDPNNPVYIVDPNVADALADDAEVNEANFDDEDGVILLGDYLRPGANTFSITVNGVGGYLQGWIDFNNDGTFGSGEQVIVNADLLQGTHQIVVQAPANLVGGQMLAARFRWGTVNIGFTGHDIIGEVEDYRFATKVPILGDFNADEVVDDADFQLWRATFGSTTDLRADGNKNGVIDAGDYALWRDHIGNSGSGAAALAAAVTEPNGGTASQSLVPEAALAGGGAFASFPEALMPAASVAVSDDAASAGRAAVLTAASSRESDIVPPLSVVELHFSTQLGHVVEAASASSAETSTSTARIDMALLLLATADLSNSQRTAVDSPSDLEWLSEQNEQDGDLDLALAAAFADEVDWRSMA